MLEARSWMLDADHAMGVPGSAIAIEIRVSSIEYLASSIW
jgi:hypothetical protein